MTLNEFISYFKGVKQIGKNEYMALCPAHNDKNPSLSIGYSEEKQCILLNCYAGCSAESILNAVGLNLKDLYTERGTKTMENIKNTTDYIYHNADGSIAYTKTRFDYTNGKKSFKFKQPNGTNNLGGVQRVPYNLPEVLNSNKIYFVEGEKCANAVIENGGVATTLDTGANSVWQEHYTDYFTDKEVIIIPDNDTAGMKYAKMVLNNIPTAKIVILPDIKEKEDIYDWLKNGHTVSEIDRLPVYNASEITDTDVSLAKKETQAETIIRLVEENGTVLFHDAICDPFAAIMRKGHQEVLPICSKGEFELWLSSIYYKATNKPAKKESLSQAISILTAKAIFDNDDIIPLYTRVAQADNDFWYYLGDKECKAVKINESGWEVVDKPPILFRKFRHQNEQCLPQKDGDVRRILKYINLQEEYHTLFLCWLASCFIPDFPHTMPIFFGEKGAAKTTACVLLKRLIDPSALDTLTLQRNPKSLAVNLQQHWFLPFDNVSEIDVNTSDMLCRAITGGGIQQRKLFTDADDYIFTFQKCIALNGIDNAATRSDLLDRGIMLEVCRIDEENRREFSVIQAEFEEDLPYILGGIFDVLVKAIEIYPTVKLSKLPRMADFARWGYAIGEALGGLGDKFLSEYEENQKERNREVLDTDIVATLIRAFMEDKKEWSGLVSQLYIELSNIAPNYGINAKSKDYPPMPNSLSRRLNNIKSNLKEAGITFEGKQTMKGRQLFIKNEKISQLPSYRHYVLDIDKGETALTPIKANMSDNDEEVTF